MGEGKDVSRVVSLSMSQTEAPGPEGVSDIEVRRPPGSLRGRGRILVYGLMSEDSLRNV